MKNKPYKGADRRSKTKRSVAFEVSPTGVSLAFIAESSSSKERTLITDRIAFSPDTLSDLDATMDVIQLNEQIRLAIVELTERHRLGGSSVAIGLGGAPCATRALLGDNADVDFARDELVQRSHRYLGLGRGEKAHCYAEKPIDAKRKRAWVTIVNREIIDGIAHAAQVAHLRISRMEHTLSAFCKMINLSGHDGDEPTLIAAATPGGTDVAISYQGQLLLDYHPATHDEGADTWSDTISKHIKCLRRFAQTQVPRSVAPIAKLYTFGTGTIPKDVEQRFRDQYDVEVRPYETAELIKNFRTPLPLDSSSGTQAAIWMAQEYLHQNAGVTTDLTDTLGNDTKVPILKLAKSVWPIAATLLVCVSMYFWSSSKNNTLEALESRIEVLRTSNLEATTLRKRLENARRIQKQIASLKSDLPNLSWRDVLIEAGQALPEGSWLEHMSIERDLTVTITGASFSDDTIYDYVRLLDEHPLFARVSLRSTRSTQTNSGRATHFEIVATVIPSKKTVTPEDSTAAYFDGCRVWTASNQSTTRKVCNG